MHTPPQAAPSPQAMPLLGGRPLPPEVFASLQHAGVKPEHIAEMCQAVDDGITTVSDYWGLTPQVVKTIEAMALDFYRQRHHMFAVLLYTFLVEIDADNAHAWRGLGAACLALHQTERAIIALQAALVIDPSDPIVLFLLGESLLVAGHGVYAKEAYTRGLARAGKDVRYAAHVRRATAIMAARDISQIRPAEPAAAGPSHPAPAAATGSAVGGHHAAPAAPPGPTAELPPDRLPTMAEAAHMTLADVERHPAMKALLDQLWEGVCRRFITVKDVAGFSDEQLVGSYNAACGYLEAGQPLVAMRIAGWLQCCDGRNPLYYQLAGVAAQQLQLFCLADAMFGFSLVYRPDDPPCELYRGEVKLFSGEPEEGRALIAGAMPRLGKDAHGVALARRGQLLLTQYPAHARSP